MWYKNFLQWLFFKTSPSCSDCSKVFPCSARWEWTIFFLPWANNTRRSVTSFPTNQYRNLSGSKTSKNKKFKCGFTYIVPEIIKYVRSKSMKASKFRERHPKLMSKFPNVFLWFLINDNYLYKWFCKIHKIF